jgi:hypothetical protein
VARQRTTFGKLQRDREKQARARAKQEKRAAGAAGGGDDAPAPAAAPADQSAVLAALAELHAAFEDGAMSLEDFESRRDDLTKKLRVD